MVENWIVQIDFNDQSKYELNKGYVKDIIKRKFGLSVFDSLTQCWYSKSIQDVEVKRLVDGVKTVGLKVSGNKQLADSLVSYFKDMKGVIVTWLDDPVDKEVNEVVTVEVNKFKAYISDRVIKGLISKDTADEFIRKWHFAVSSYEYEKRGVEY